MGCFKHKMRGAAKRVFQTNPLFFFYRINILTIVESSQDVVGRNYFNCAEMRIHSQKDPGVVFLDHQTWNMFLAVDPVFVIVSLCDWKTIDAFFGSPNRLL